MFELFKIQFLFFTWSLSFFDENNAEESRALLWEFTIDNSIDDKIESDRLLDLEHWVNQSICRNEPNDNYTRKTNFLGIDFYLWLVADDPEDICCNEVVFSILNSDFTIRWGFV